ncbi:unnamed protein product [Arctogadus glacialis]
MRDGPSPVCNLLGQVHRSRFVFLVLGLLNVALLLTAMVLGIYCSKTEEAYLQLLQSSERLPYMLEFLYLQENQSEVIKATKEAERTLRLEVSTHEAVRQQAEKQNSLHQGLQSQIERARTEKEKLLAAKLDIEQSCGRCQEGWQYCLGHQADLLVIESLEEQKLLNDNIPKLGAATWWKNAFWKGLTENVVEDTWTYFLSGQPVDGPDMTCAAFIRTLDSTHAWLDGRCHGYPLHWICEMKPNEK